MTHLTGEYRATDSMSKLLCDHFLVMPVVARFGIPLGVAERSIEEVCREKSVCCATFLAIVNLMLRHRESSYRPSLEGVDIDSVVRYLQSAHQLYLTQRLPRLRHKLLEVLGNDTISKLIVRYFDDFVEQTKAHLQQEEQEVFPYIKALAQGECSSDYSIERFSAQHEHIDEPLNEFKNVIINYYSGNSSDAMVEIIHDLLACAKDIAHHNMVEDRLLVPLIRKIEAQ